MHLTVRIAATSAATSAALSAALSASASLAQPISLVASEFSAPTGSQANGFGDFETESSVGMLFYASEGGRLESLEFVLSDISGFVPEEAKTDVELRFYTWENGTLGEELAFIALPHEEIPDHVTQFTNWTWDTFDFPSRGLHVPIEAGRNYCVIFSLRIPFTTPQYGRPNILGLARDREGPIYPAGEAVRRDADGSTIVFSRATEVSPSSAPGLLDFFHRVNVSRSPLPTDANSDTSLDVFDAIEFLRGFDSAEATADYDLSGTLDATDIRVFFSQLIVEASR